MIQTIPELLTAEQLAEIDKALSTATYVDGSVTAGQIAEPVKKNLQADRQASPDLGPADQIILTALGTHRLVRAAALPMKMCPPLYNRHDVGMRYGPHSDNPVIRSNPPTRTDVSVTVFLSDPDTYDGGELILETEAGPAKIKLPRGAAVMYSTNVIHRVEEVTRGSRLAAVTWIQSMISDPYRRQMLFEIDLVCQRLNAANAEAEEARLLTKNYNNLLRLWSEV